MAYRETARMRDKRALTQTRIEQAALKLVASGGFKALQVSDVAAAASIATGSLYRYFTNKEALACRVFEMASQQEVDQATAVISAHDDPITGLEQALRTFAKRALKAPVLAWALIAEPVDAAVDEKRLQYRLMYANVFAGAIQHAMARHQISRQRAMLTATAMVGAIAEALIGPLADKAQITLVPAAQQQVIDDIIHFCLHGLRVTTHPPASVRSSL